jgi:hypothetical protein
MAMIGQWSLSLVRKQVPEVSSEPIRIRFHIAAEMATALALLAGGSGAYARVWFAQRGDWRAAGFFAVLIALALVSLVLLD